MVSGRALSHAELWDPSSSEAKNHSFYRRVPRHHEIIGSVSNRQRLTRSRFIPFMCLVSCGEFTRRASAVGTLQGAGYKKRTQSSDCGLNVESGFDVEDILAGGLQQGLSLDQEKP